jgi:hypothetical protein
MKKQSQKKLALQRETLAPLQPQNLDAVAGGNASLDKLTQQITRLGCVSLVRLCA